MTQKTPKNIISKSKFENKIQKLDNNSFIQLLRTVIDQNNENNTELIKLLLSKVKNIDYKLIQSSHKFFVFTLLATTPGLIVGIILSCIMTTLLSPLPYFSYLTLFFITTLSCVLIYYAKTYYQNIYDNAYDYAIGNKYETSANIIQQIKAQDIATEALDHKLPDGILNIITQYMH